MKQNIKTMENLSLIINETKDQKIVCFDIEATGLNTDTDRIIELSMVIIENQSIEVKTRRFKPLIPISPEATEVHGITNEDLKDCITFDKVAKSISKIMDGATLAGYNLIRFDIPILASEFERIGIDHSLYESKILDGFTCFRKQHPRDLNAAYQIYCGKDLENAHSAEADTLATIEIIQEQIKSVGGVDQLAEYCKDPTMVDFAGKLKRDKDGYMVYNIGKSRGMRVEDDPSLAVWMLEREFPSNTKKHLVQELERIGYLYY